MKTKELVFTITGWRTKTKRGVNLHLAENVNPIEMYESVRYCHKDMKDIVYNEKLVSVTSKASHLPISTSKFNEDNEDIWR